VHRNREWNAGRPLRAASDHPGHRQRTFPLRIVEPNAIREASAKFLVCGAKHEGLGIGLPLTSRRRKARDQIVERELTQSVRWSLPRNDRGEQKN
jgi:hypothetical protein